MKLSHSTGYKQDLIESCNGFGTKDYAENWLRIGSIFLNASWYKLAQQ